MILFLIALFHGSLYYCNIDLFSKKETPSRDTDSLTESKVQLQNYLNELKQYDVVNTHG
jgi:hypothetical protein